MNDELEAREKETTDPVQKFWSERVGQIARLGTSMIGETFAWIARQFAEEMLQTGVAKGKYAKGIRYLLREQAKAWKEFKEYKNHPALFLPRESSLVGRTQRLVWFINKYGPKEYYLGCKKEDMYSWGVWKTGEERYKRDSIFDSWGVTFYPWDEEMNEECKYGKEEDE